MLRQGRLYTFALLGVLVTFPVDTLDGQTRESFAILDLEGRGISAIEAEALTDRLSSLIVKTGRVTVVERGQMQAVLLEQDFQLTGCTSDECAVEVGQLLGVTKMVAGSIGKIGSTYSLDLRTIDIATGEITNSIIRDYRGEIDGLLEEMVEIAKEIVEFEVGPLEPSEQALQPEEQAQPATQQPVAVVQRQGRGRSMLWIVLGLAAAGGGVYALTLGGDGPPPVEAPTVGFPPLPPQ